MVVDSSFQIDGNGIRGAKMTQPVQSNSSPQIYKEYHSPRKYKVFTPRIKSIGPKSESETPFYPCGVFAVPKEWAEEYIGCTENMNPEYFNEYVLRRTNHYCILVIPCFV